MEIREPAAAMLQGLERRIARRPQLTIVCQAEISKAASGKGMPGCIPAGAPRLILSHCTSDFACHQTYIIKQRCDVASE